MKLIKANGCFSFAFWRNYLVKWKFHAQEVSRSPSLRIAMTVGLYFLYNHTTIYLQRLQGTESG